MIEFRHARATRHQSALLRPTDVLHVNLLGTPASPFIALRIEHSLIERTVERELIRMARALNVGLTAWSPLSNGVLTGKCHGHECSDRDRAIRRLSLVSRFGNL